MNAEPVIYVNNIGIRAAHTITRAIFDRYNIVDEADLRSAAEKLERYTERRKAERAAKLVRWGEAAGRGAA